MEIGKTAMGTPKKSPKQTKLTQVYRVEKRTPVVEKAKGGKQGDGICLMVDFGFVKKQPVDFYESENVVEARKPEAVIKRPEAAALLCRASNVMTLSPSRDIQSGYNCFPGREPVANSFEIQKLGGMSLQQVKVELLSPGSCVTNDSVFREASGMGGGEILSMAHVNAETTGVDAESVVVFPCGKESVSGTQVTSVIEGDALQSSKHVATVSVSPVKSLSTALVMFPDDSIAEQTMQPVTPAASDSSTLEVSTFVMATAGSLPSVQKVLGPVKVEAVESKEKLITALDMFGGGHGEEGPSGATEAHSQSRRIEAPTPDATLMTALDMFPAEVQKLEVMEHSQVDVGCEEMSLVPTAKVNKPAAPLKSVLVHVKSEPVDNSRVTGACMSLNELERVALQNEMSQILRNAVKQELLNSMPEYPSGDLTQRNEHQASQQSLEPKHSSSGSEDSDETEDECLPSQVHNGAEEFTEMVYSRSQKRDKTLESQKEKEIKNRTSNLGMRIQSGRIYDSFLGKTCHWCRQKTVEHHVKCRECKIYYCGPCLMNRNGENIREELAEGVKWLCPKCRNGCGPGCENCCNCGPCRKADGKAPTGQLIREARKAGFLNAHDYLVHLETGEAPEVIAQRKVGRNWTNCGRYEWKVTSENSESRDEPSSSEGTDEFTLDEETCTQLHEGKIGMKFVKKFVQSQLKRKRGATRGALPATKSQVEASSSVRRQDVNNIIARLKSPAEKISKRNDHEVEAASRRVEQKFKEESALRLIQEDIALRNQNNGMRIKREVVEVNAGINVRGSDVGDTAFAKRRKLEGYAEEQRYAPLSELMSSKSSLLSPFSRVKCKVEPTTLCEDNPSSVGVDNSNEAGPRRKFSSDADTPAGPARPSKDSVSESELTLKMRRASVNGAKTGLNNAASQLMFEQRGLECPSDPQGTEYRTKLKSVLAQPFDAKELEILEESARCRKPVQKLRQMRGRIVDIVTEDEGFSYLDYHQDFTLKLEEAQGPPLKLALLRGFFFWLQHSCMEGAFRPWSGAPTESRPQSGDCIETEGPDCQVTAVVLQLDEGKDAFRTDECNEAHRPLKRKYTEMVQRPLEIPNRVCGIEMTFNPLGSSTMTQAKKKSLQHVKLPKMRGQVQKGINYRVVLGLPAPSLFKKR